MRYACVFGAGESVRLVVCGVSGGRAKEKNKKQQLVSSTKTNNLGDWSSNRNLCQATSGDGAPLVRWEAKRNANNTHGKRPASE